MALSSLFKRKKLKWIIHFRKNRNLFFSEKRQKKCGFDKLNPYVKGFIHFV